jgi:hypothetical protein
MEAIAPVPPMALDGLWPNRRWTHEMKARLGAMGLERGHAVFADECLGAGPQWVFALCWVDLRKGRMRSIPLAVEIDFLFAGYAFTERKLVFDLLVV